MTRKNEWQIGEIIILTPGTLAALTAIVQDSAVAVEVDGRLGTARIIGNWTGTAGEAQRLVYGICQGGMTAAEVKAILEQTPERPNDTEIRTGYARIIGPIVSPGQSAGFATYQVDSGWVKLNMEFFDDSPTYALFLFNYESAPMTTGGDFRSFVQGLANPVRR